MQKLFKKSFKSVSDQPTSYNPTSDLNIIDVNIENERRYWTMRNFEVRAHARAHSSNEIDF